MLTTLLQKADAEINESGASRCRYFYDNVGWRRSKHVTIPMRLRGRCGDKEARRLQAAGRRCAWTTSRQRDRSDVTAMLSETLPRR